MTDAGVTELIKALEAQENGLERIDLSGNSIGQSSYFEGCSNAIASYLEKNKSLQVLAMNNNMLRGKHAEKIMRQIQKCDGLQSLSLAHNFLG